MIIGLIGAPEAGKDIIANFFVENKLFKRLAFADEIKNGYYSETGYTEEQFKISRGTPLELQIRNGLWEYSARICNEFGKLYFVRKVVDSIGNDNVVVTDVRTDEELEILENECNAKIFLVLRNFRKELSGETLLGTKLKLSRIIHYDKIWNIYNSLDEIYAELHNIFEELQETDMDPDGETFKTV